MKTIKGRIQEVIRPNGVGAITAAEHQALLLEMVDTIETEIGDSKSEVRKDGNYPSMTVGKADNLVGRGESTLSEYSFRASGGKSIEDGTARIKTLHGNAVVWNQLIIEEKLFANNAETTKTTNGYTIVPTASSPGLRIIDNLEPILGHTYILLCDKIGGTVGLYLNWGGWNKSIPDRIFTVTDVSKKTFTVYSYNETETFTLTSPRLVDLTKMFGAGNEPTTIEEYYARKPIVENEYAYNEGEVIAFTADGIKSVGDNAWDEEWEFGIFDNNTGAKVPDDTSIRSKNPIKVLPNETYYIYSEPYVRMHTYDTEMNQINTFYVGGETYGKTFTTPTNCAYVNFRTVTVYGTTYKNDICISLAHSGYKEGQYFPYEQDIRKIDSRILEAFPNGIKAVKGTSDKVYNKNGKGYIEHRIGVKKMKDLAWTSPNSNLMALGIFNASIGDMRTLASGEAEATYRRSGVLSRYVLSSEASFGDTMTDKSMWRQGSPYGVIVRDSEYTSVDAFVASLKDEDVVYYELAEPTIIEYDEPFNLDYLVWDFGTEEIIASKPSAPLKADIIYQFNAVDEIRENYNEIQAIKAALVKAGITLDL